MEEIRQDSQINISKNNNSNTLKYLIIVGIVLIGFFAILFLADKKSEESIKQDISKKIYTKEEKLEILNSLLTGNSETGEISSSEERREILNFISVEDKKNKETPLIEERYRILNEIQTTNN